MKIIPGFAVALLLGAALPAAAQIPPPPPIEAPGPMGRGMFAGMSDAGRTTMANAMRATDRRENRAAVKAARDRMLTALDAERLDVTALKRAMEDERAAAVAARTEHNSAMLPAFQALSTADRRAFVANMRAMRTRVEGRMAAFKERRAARREGRMMPPM